MTQESFEDNILPLRPKLQRLARSFFGNSDDADDATQDALLRLWRLRGQLPEAGIEIYAQRVLKNVCIDQWRRRQTQPQDLESIVEPLHADTPHSRLEAHEAEEHLARLIAQLPERHRLLLRMRFEDGLPTEQISRLTAIPSRSVSAMISEAKARLRKAMNKENQ